MSSVSRSRQLEEASTSRRSEVDPSGSALVLRVPAREPEQEPDEEDRYPNEEQRWVLALGMPMLIPSAVMAATIGTGIRWLVVSCLAFGPGRGALSPSSI